MKVETLRVKGGPQGHSLSISIDGQQVDDAQFMLLEASVDGLANLRLTRIRRVDSPGGPILESYVTDHIVRIEI